MTANFQLQIITTCLCSGTPLHFTATTEETMSQTARNVAANANETDAGQPANKKPVANFKLAGVEASVWSNKSEKGEFYNITFQRRYQDKDQQWQTTHS
jgi:hypothetical protein